MKKKFTIVIIETIHTTYNGIEAKDKDEAAEIAESLEERYMNDGEMPGNIESVEYKLEITEETKH